MRINYYKNIEEIMVIRKGLNEVVRFLPVEIDKDNKLFHSYQAILDYPGWSGTNWGAINDFFCYPPSYLNAEKVLIIHQDLPFKYDLDSLKIYLDIINTYKILDSNCKTDYRFYFPESVKPEIERLLTEIKK